MHSLLDSRSAADGWRRSRGKPCSRRGLYWAARTPRGDPAARDLHSPRLYSSGGTSLSSGSGQLAMGEKAECRESRSQGHHSRRESLRNKTEGVTVHRLVDPKDLSPQSGLSRIPEMLPMPSIKRVDVINSECTIKMRNLFAVRIINGVQVTSALEADPLSGWKRLADKVHSVVSGGPSRTQLVHCDPESRPISSARGIALSVDRFHPN